MRLLAVLFLAATASAQWVSSVEQSYGPYDRPEQGGRHAAAVGDKGILLAWSETIGAPRIRVGLLDSRAQLVSEIATLPVQGESAEAYTPAVAFNGESFLVAWVERYRGGQKIRSVVVDDSGAPILPARTHGFAHAEGVTPLIVWDGTAWQVLEGDRSGLQAATRHNGVFASATWKKSFIFAPCGRIAICPVKANRWDIDWTAGDRSGSERIGDEWPTGNTSPGGLELAPAGDDFAIAWATNLGIGYRFAFSQRSENVHADAEDDVAPGLACDNERCLIAYGTSSGDIHGIVVDTDALGSAELLFTITASERKEHSPRVHNLGSGRFLVSYLSDQTAADQRLNGRIVSFESARRRAMRRG